MRIPENIDSTVLLDFIINKDEKFFSLISKYRTKLKLPIEGLKSDHEYTKWSTERSFEFKLWLGDMLMKCADLTEEIELEPISQWPVRNFLFFGSLLVNENVSVLFDIEDQRLQILTNGKTKTPDVALAWKFVRDNDLQKYLDDFQRKTDRPVKDLTLMKRASQLKREHPKMTYLEVTEKINQEFDKNYGWNDIQQKIRDYNNPKNAHLYKADMFPLESENNVVEKMTEIILDNYL